MSMMARANLIGQRMQLSSLSSASSTVAVVFSLLLAAVIVASSDAASLASTNLKQQQTTEAADEPLLRYSFAQFLANPCGLMSSSPSSSSSRASSAALSKSSRNHHIIKSIGMRILDSQRRSSQALSSSSPTTGSGRPGSGASSSSLSQETHQFLDPIRQRYNNINRSLFTDAEQMAIVQELLLVTREVKFRSQLMHPQKDLHECEHIQLSSLPDTKQLINQKGEFEVKEIYRALALTAAHLHLMIRDHLDVVAATDDATYSSSFQLPLPRPFCPPMDEPFHQQNLRVLTGKVETLMCLIFPMRGTGADGDDDDKKRNDQLFDVIKSVLMQTFLHRKLGGSMIGCSAREMRSCLVVRYALDVMGVTQQLAGKKLSQQRRSI